jgi:hypothetical protein
VQWAKVSGPGTVTFAAPNAVDTQASFTAPGIYLLRLWAYDGALDASDSVTVVVNPWAVEARVAAGSDDAEELSGGSVSLSSSDLEMMVDGTLQRFVGVRFRNLGIPRNSTITRAYIQFQTDETGSGSTPLTIAVQVSDNAPTFSSTTNNLSSRTRTGAVNWSPPAWNIIDEAGSAQRTTDLSALVQAIVNRALWQPNNGIAFLISGTGKRVARAYESGASKAALLHVEYSPPAAAEVASSGRAAEMKADAADADLRLSAERGHGALRFVLPQAGPVRIDLFDTQGRRVSPLVDHPFLPAGTHTVAIPPAGGRLQAGIYFYRLVSARGSLRGRIVVIE